jgi:outer membrane protein TolC
MNRLTCFPFVVLMAATAFGQDALTLSLKDALSRAEKNAPQVLSAMTDVAVAHEDVQQARAAVRPSASFRSDYLGTQGNGTLPSGRFVTNDGVHVYRDWGVIHQDFTAVLTRTGQERATAAEALAKAKIEIARRGLGLTVTRAYYALLAAQHKYTTAVESLDQAKRYVDISQNLRKGGEVARSDVVRAELVSAGQEQAVREAKLNVDNAKLDLAVLVFPNFEQSFSVMDDLSQAASLPEYAELQRLAGHENPDLAAAATAVTAAKVDVKIARQSSLPSLTSDFAYGIEANAFALHSTVAAAPDKGKLPNLGYFLTVSLNVPVWDWGARNSKVRAAEAKRAQANADLNTTQRTLLRNLQGFYQEAQAARDQLVSLKKLVDLSNENLRLNGLRYQAGEATILELVDAQTTLIQARNSYDDGLVRYRLAVANLQSLTGTF